MLSGDRWKEVKEKCIMKTSAESILEQLQDAQHTRDIFRFTIWETVIRNIVIQSKKFQRTSHKFVFKLENDILHLPYS